MHHLGVKKTNILNSGSAETPCKLLLGSAGNEQPLCPKPRRVGPAVPEFLKPLRCNKHSQQNSDERSGVLNMITEKLQCTFSSESAFTTPIFFEVGEEKWKMRGEDIVDGREYVCTKCSPACYSGSPPGRTHNPLVHDVQFLHQMELLSPFTRTKLCNKFGFSTTSASPV